MSTVEAVRRQVRVSEWEAGFSLFCTLGVCVYQEWGRWHHVAAAVAIPIAMAFSVHGVNNANGLDRWNLVYVPTRVVVIALGVAYSYQHYYHFLPTLEVGGVDLKPAVAFIMELLTLSALIAHQGHTARLATLAIETATEPIDPVESPDDDPVERTSSGEGPVVVPESVPLFVPSLLAVGSSNGSRQP